MRPESKRIGAEDGARHLGAPGADQPGDAEDLAACGPRATRRRAPWRAGRGLVAAARQPFDRERDLAGDGSRRGGEERVDLAADHQADDAVDIGLGDLAAADERPSRSTV